MMNFRNFFLSIYFASALATQLQAADENQSISARDYQVFVTAVATTQDPHGLYQPEMAGQIFCEEQAGQKNYCVIDGHESETMQHMTQLDAMRYCNWKEHHCPSEKEDPTDAALSTESGAYDLENDSIIFVHEDATYHLASDGEGQGSFFITGDAQDPSASPLMMLGCCWGEEKENPSRSNRDIEMGTGRGGDVRDSSSAAERGKVASAMKGSSHQAPPTSLMEKIKIFFSQILEYLQRFFCCFGAREEQSIPSDSAQIKVPSHGSSQQVAQPVVLQAGRVKYPGRISLFKDPRDLLVDNIERALRNQQTSISELVKLKKELKQRQFWDRTRYTNQDLKNLTELAGKIDGKLSQYVLEKRNSASTSVRELIQVRDHIQSEKDSFSQFQDWINQFNSKIRAERNQTIPIAISSRTQITPWLATLGFSVNQNITVGEGGFGILSPTTDHGFGIPLIYKQEKAFNSATEMCGVGQIHREGNLVAASGGLPNMVKIVALIMKMSKKDNPQQTFLYLPCECVKKFTEELQQPLVNKIVDFAVVGQLMERASGEEVGKTLTSAAWWGNTLQDRIDYFDAIVPEILKYYEVALARNFVHLDIKISNLFFNLQNKKLTILDPGISVQLDPLRNWSERMREAISGKPQLSNRTSKRQIGTMPYLAPGVLKGQPYGAEVDAYAFGKVLLEIIDKQASSQVWQKQFEELQVDSNNQPINLDVIFIKKAKDCLQYMKGSEQSFLRTFLTSDNPLMKLRRKLIDAFFALGSSCPENVLTNTRASKWSSLQSAYKAYRTAYEKAQLPTSKN